MELFAQTAYEVGFESSSNSVSPVFWFFYFGVLLLFIVALWKVFEKAGYDGWKSLIPFYNTYILFEIAGMNGWMFLLMFIPFVNFVISIYLALELAKKFDKSVMFAIFGLVIFNFIGYLMLGFGDAKYVDGGEKEAEPAE